jgi:hypothetical protein
MPQDTLLRQPTLEFAFRVRLEFAAGERLRFQPAFAEFRRGFVSVLGGAIEGPRLKGRVVPQTGGDWPRLWASGLVEFDARYLLEASDGTPILIHNTGLAYSSPEVMARLEAGERVEAEATYCRITPRFEVPRGPHEWLARSIFVGTGERRGDHSLFEYYVVT